MHRPLPAAWDLIKDSWKAFIKTWDTTVRIAAWFIPAAILQGLYVLVPTNQEALRNSLEFLGALASVIIMIWASIRLYLAVLAIEEGKKQDPKNDQKAWSLFLPLILVGILNMLCVLGGLVVLILPGIYVGIRLGFAQLALLRDNARGRQALIASWNLTKGRFWPIFGRQLAAGALFGLFMGLVLMVAIMVVQLAAGGALTALMKDPNNPTGTAVSNLIASIVQAGTVPLVALFQVKLFHALKGSKA